MWIGLWPDQVSLFQIGRCIQGNKEGIHVKKIITELIVLNTTFPDVISSKLKAEDRRSKLQLGIEQVTIDTPIFAGMERIFCNCNRNSF